MNLGHNIPICKYSCKIANLKTYQFILGFACTVPKAHLVFAKTVMVLGDSISAGYGIEPQQAWVNFTAKTVRPTVSETTQSGQCQCGG